MPLAATIAQTADWLVRAHPIVYTDRAGNQPLLADPFTLFQQNVQQDSAWWADKYIHASTGKRGYRPDPNSKTGRAGTRAARTVEEVGVLRVKFAIWCILSRLSGVCAATC